MSFVLELQDATVAKDGHPVLDGVTLAVRVGEHTAIMGPNGAGKSALMQLLTCQDRPLVREGAPPPVRILGEDRWNVFELRPRLGIVSADLHHRFVVGNTRGRIRVSDAVLSGYFGMHGLTPVDAVTHAMREGAVHALGRMEADHLANRFMDELSTGEARRVVIARALVTTPSALVLDEPSTGLDLLARHRLVQLMDRVARAGTTLILVTHQVEELVPAISKVVFLKRGRILAEGSRDVMVTSERLSQLFDAPIEIIARGDRLAAVVSGRASL